MRIVYCIPGLYNAGGMERVLTQKVNWLAQHTNWEITIVTTEPVPYGQHRCYFPLDERVEVVELNIDFNADYKKGWVRRIAGHIHKQRVYKTQMVDLLVRKKADVWVSLCGKEIEWMGKVKIACRKIAEIHFAIDFREQWLQQQHKGGIWSAIGKFRTCQLVRNMQRIDRLVVLTSADQQAWQKKGIYHTDVITNPCYIMPQQEGSHHLNQILAVGRLEVQKGFDWLIEAWSKIATNFPDWTLRICGEGNERENLKLKIEDLRLKNRVIMEGLCNNLEEEYQNCKLFVLSSRYEGLPLALMEAMSCGVGCIAMDCEQGPSELIGHNERGVLVKKGDVTGLAQAIAQSINAPTHLQSLGNAARTYALKHWDIASVMQQWMQLFSGIEVVHTVNAFGEQSGGTSTCVYDLAKGMNETQSDSHIQVVVTQPISAKLMGNGEPWIHAVHNDELTSFGYSRALKRALNSTYADIYHTNGLWRYCNHVTALIARKKHKPLVITPHGMLYPQALEHSKWKKQVLKFIYFRHDINTATCLHATCEEEINTIRAYGYKGPVALIGNAVSVPQEIGSLPQRPSTGKKKFGFLGRLHPRKQVERILYAMAQLSAKQQEQSQIIIMGAGDDTYEQFLRYELERLQLHNVIFKGFVSGKDKYIALSELSALIVPSDFENFGMIIPEALLCHTPVMAGIHTPWKALNTCHCGWWKEVSVEHIAQVMKQVIEMNPDEIDAMGQRGEELIRTQHKPDHVHHQMQQLYLWLLNKTNKPDFIYETRD